MDKRTRKRILIISHDKIGSSMAGPGIRYHYMAQVLSLDFDVTVGFFDPSYLPDKDFERRYKTTHIDHVDFEKAFNNKDTVISMWVSDKMIEYCNSNKIFLVFDMYAPVPVENLALFIFNGKDTNPDSDYTYRQSFAMFEKFFANGDLFIFSNRRQLDYWTGYVFGTDQVSVSNYKIRPFFDRFIYGSMGIDANQALKHTKKVMRDHIPGIKKTDKIILWTGGIWNWFDAQILIKAMKLLEEKHPDIKLVFFGTKHPNPNVPEMIEASETLKLAKQYKLLNKSVFLLDGWVDYTDRINYLLEADVAVSTCKPSIESEFSHRTRVLDHILAGLPTIATAGDYLTDEVVVPKNLGISVPPNDEVALSSAILESLDLNNHISMKKSLEYVKKDYDWNNTLKQLRDTLISDLPKLDKAPQIKKVKQIPNNKIANIGKKITPLYIKKMYLRIFKYGQ
jgi:glycosyltransferase involved in cell wall biosynthesis